MTDQTLKPTQADRGAAARLWSLHHGKDALYDAILAGDADTCSHVQSHARHRLAHSTPDTLNPEALRALADMLQRVTRSLRLHEVGEAQPGSLIDQAERLAALTLARTSGDA